MQDREEAGSDKLLHARGYHQERRRLLRGVLTTSFGADWATTELELTVAQIEERLSPYLAVEREHLNTYFPRDKNASKQPKPILIWLLGQIGLSLGKRQLKRKGKRPYVYCLNRDDLLKMWSYAESRLASLKLERAAYK